MLSLLLYIFWHESLSTWQIEFGPYILHIFDHVFYFSNRVINIMLQKCSSCVAFSSCYLLKSTLIKMIRCNLKEDRATDRITSKKLSKWCWSKLPCLLDTPGLPDLLQCLVHPEQHIILCRHIHAALNDTFFQNDRNKNM